ncbi:MAG: 3-dehydroquinate synthase [Alphaproteobacteria bacterium]
MTASVETIGLDLGARSYDILVGPGLLASAGAHIKPVLRQKSVVIVTDANVAKYHLATLEHALAEVGIDSQAIVLEPGEQAKEFPRFAQLVDQILDTRPERASMLVALGGGVIGDLTGFAASVVLRGIEFTQIPTTLLAQVDSSVGGKTGINTRHGKNLVGAFYQPRLVLADTKVLDTLPRRELLAGYAETVKYGLLGDAGFFDWLDANADGLLAGDSDARRYAIVESCRAKARIVAEDEREGGARALLNLGHTFGHALETETGFGKVLLHGEAVAIGMAMAFDLSARLGLCAQDDVRRVRRHLAAVGLPCGLDALDGTRLNPAALIAHMRQDKKVRDGRITFILTRGIGEAFITDDVDVAEVEALLTDAVPA